MKKVRIYQGDRVIADPAFIADSFITRFKGLMLRKKTEPGEGLLLMSCPAIHCCFMRFTIDVIYLDEEMTVLDVETVKPWRVGKHVRGAKHVLEIETGRAAYPICGEKLTIREE